jgi:hypothetical protein
VVARRRGHLRGKNAERRRPVRDRHRSLGKIAGLRQTLADLPDDAPYVEWGRWFLSDRATRSVGPGFTITPAEAEKLADTLSAPAPKL